MSVWPSSISTLTEMALTLHPSPARRKAHEQVGCWCSYEHSLDGECLHAQWVEDLAIIYRCHGEALEGTKRCLLHTTNLNAQ